MKINQTMKKNQERFVRCHRQLKTFADLCETRDFETPAEIREAVRVDLGVDKLIQNPELTKRIKLYFVRKKNGAKGFTVKSGFVK